MYLSLIVLFSRRGTIKLDGFLLTDGPTAVRLPRSYPLLHVDGFNSQHRKYAPKTEHSTSTRLTKAHQTTLLTDKKVKYPHDKTSYQIQQPEWTVPERKRREGHKDDSHYQVTTQNRRGRKNTSFFYIKEDKTLRIWANVPPRKTHGEWITA